MMLGRMIRVIGWKRDRHACYWAIDGSLLVILACAGESRIEQDDVERTINAVDGIVVRVIGRCVAGGLEVVAKAAEAFAYLDGRAPQQGLFKLPGICLVIMGLGDGLLQQRQRTFVADGCQAMAQLAQGFFQGIGVR